MSKAKILAAYAAKQIIEHLNGYHLIPKDMSEDGLKYSIASIIEHTIE